MSVFEVRMKTHSVTDVTWDFKDEMNFCIIHHRIPQVYKLIYGKHKDIMYTMNCDHPDCGRCTEDKNKVVAIWNKWNPASDSNQSNIK